MSSSSRRRFWISIRRLVVFCVASAALGACGGNGQFSPSVAPRGAAIHGLRGHSASSWMAPDAKTSDLLYISDGGTNDVYVFAYPTGILKGTLTGLDLPEGECVDAVGNVYVTSYLDNNVRVYAHGAAKSIRILKDPGYYPIGCSVDPKTGDIAVTNDRSTSSGQGNIAIYKAGKVTPKAYYTDPAMMIVLFCGYDNTGNLFVDGGTSGSAFVFAELPAGSSSFKNIKLDQPFKEPGGVQWDGKHVAVGDLKTNVIYQFRIKGRKGTEVGSTPLIGSTHIGQFWIHEKKVIGPDYGAGDVGFWAYPAGGSAKKKITGLSGPIGATISVKV